MDVAFGQTQPVAELAVDEVHPVLASRKKYPPIWGIEFRGVFFDSLGSVVFRIHADGYEKNILSQLVSQRLLRSEEANHARRSRRTIDVKKIDENHAVLQHIGIKTQPFAVLGDDFHI